MATMNISLPDELKDFIDAQVAENSFMSSSEYIRSLVRKEHAVAKLRAMILEGANSPIVAVADEAYFESKRERIRRAVAARKAS
jgi:antitoxin ParD1/3/4